MSNFSDFKDEQSPGENMVVVDPTDPSRKASVSNSDLSVNDGIDIVATPIHTSVGTSAVRIDNPILSNRKSVTIEVQKDVYIGYSNTITVASGWAYFLRKGQLISLILGPSTQLWAISGNTGGTSDVIVNQGAKS